MNPLKITWANRCQQLVGRTITAVTYLSERETGAIGWEHSAICLELDDGTLLFPSRDDEGNDAGAMFVQHGQACDKVPEVIGFI